MTTPWWQTRATPLTAKPPRCCLNTYALRWLYLRKAEKGPDLGLNMKREPKQEGTAGRPGTRLCEMGCGCISGPPSLLSGHLQWLHMELAWPQLWPRRRKQRVQGLQEPSSQACISFLCEITRDTLRHWEREVTR